MCVTRHHRCWAAAQAEEAGEPGNTTVAMTTTMAMAMAKETKNSGVAATVSERARCNGRYRCKGVIKISKRN